MTGEIGAKGAEGVLLTDRKLTLVILVIRITRVLYYSLNLFKVAQKPKELSLQMENLPLLVIGMMRISYHSFKVNKQPIKPKEGSLQMKR